MFLEIFKTGVHTDSSGISGEYSTENLDRIAAGYQKRMSENPNDKAPVVAGHPESHEGAKGWVRKIFRRGNSLVADVEFTDEGFVNSIKNGDFRNVSIAIDADFGFIHLGFLGAVPPAVEGLNPFRYSAVSSYEIFDENIIVIPAEDAQMLKKVEELENKNLQFSKTIEDYEKKLRTLEFQEFIKSADNNPASKLFSKERQENFSELLEMAYRLDLAENSDAVNLNKVKSIISGFSNLERKLEFSAQLTAKQIYPAPNLRLEPERNSIHLKTVELMREIPGISYEDALLLTNTQ